MFQILQILSQLKRYKERSGIVCYGQFFQIISKNFKTCNTYSLVKNLFVRVAFGWTCRLQLEIVTGVYILQNTMARGRGEMVPGKKMKNEAVRKKKEKGERKKK